MQNFDDVLVEAPTKGEYAALAPVTKAGIEFDFFIETGEPVEFMGNNGERLGFCNRPRDGAYNFKKDGLIVKASHNREELVELAAQYL